MAGAYCRSCLLKNSTVAILIEVGLTDAILILQVPHYFIAQARGLVPQL